MKPWLAYGGAFLCGVGTLALLNMAAVTLSLAGLQVSVTVLLFAGIIGPALAGFIVFGLSYGKFSGKPFSQAEWVVAFVFFAIIMVIAAVLVATTLLPSSILTLGAALVLLVGGAAILQRRGQ